MIHPDTQEPATSEPTGAKRWYALAVLTGIFAAHYLDRSVISVIVEPLKHAFGISDAGMGVLAGLAHSTALAVFVLPVGWLADRYHRVRLISALVILWSLLTAMGALATGFWSLLLMRIGVGAAEAGAPPASVSLISDMFAPRDRPVAFGIFYLAAAIGTGTIFLTGGYAAHLFGWRAVFLIAGIPGVVLGLLLLLTIRDPRSARKDVITRPRPTLREATGALRASPTLRWVTAGGTLATVAQTAIWTWMASFLIRLHGLTLVQAGIVVGISAGLGKGMGSVASGILTRSFARGQAWGGWRYAGSVLVASVPLAWLMVTTQSNTVAVACTFALGVALGGWAGPAVAILVDGITPPFRGTAMSCYHLSTNLIGAGAGPLLTGALSDALGGNKGLAPAIGITVTINLLAAYSLYLGARGLRPT